MDQKGKKKNKTQLYIAGKKTRRLLKLIQIDQNALHANDFKASGEFSWKGSPFAINWNTTNGHANLSSAKGVIINKDADNKAARFISALSINSLIRKFSLDFSDYFDEGFHFDNFTGLFNLKEGVLQTDNTQINGITASIKMKGSTDLKTEVLNYNISVIPKLASSVPTVLLLTSGTTIALLAFAASKALEPVIDVISELRYKVSGTMDRPVITEVLREQKFVEVPEDVIQQSQEIKKQQKNEQQREEKNAINSLHPCLTNQG